MQKAVVEKGGTQRFCYFLDLSRFDCFPSKEVEATIFRQRLGDRYSYSSATFDINPLFS